MTTKDIFTFCLDLCPLELDDFCLDFSNVLKHNGQYETAYYLAAFADSTVPC